MTKEANNIISAREVVNTEEMISEKGSCFSSYMKEKIYKSLAESLPDFIAVSESHSTEYNISTYEARAVVLTERDYTLMVHELEALRIKAKRLEHIINITQDRA